jgi:hypothetical protein
VFAKRDSAEANLKITNLWELNEKWNLDLAQVKMDNKCLSNLLKLQKTLAKKDQESSHTSPSPTHEECHQGSPGF